MTKGGDNYGDSSTLIRVRLFYVQLLAPIVSLPLVILFLFLNYQISILIAAGVFITIGIAHQGKKYIKTDGECGWSRQTVEWIPIILFSAFIISGFITGHDLLFHTAMMFNIISLLFFFYATKKPGDGRRLF